MTARTQRAPAPTAPYGAPSWLLLGSEPMRAACEFAGALFVNPERLPQGDGHPVVLFPGLAADACAMRPLRDLCRRLGYDAHDWGRGWNTGPSGDVDEWLAALTADITALVGHDRQRVSLIGWSLGGIYAREVAKRLGASKARQVITLGTPFTCNVEHTRAGFLYRLVNGSRAPVSAELARRVAAAPDIPSTSIYSRTDGVVAWQACVQARGHRRTENIEVSGSHTGLVWNTAVLEVIADRLSQPQNAWRPHRQALPRVSAAAAA